MRSWPFHDLEEVASLFIRQRRHSPILEHEEFAMGEGAQDFVVASVGLGDGEVLEERGAILLHFFELRMNFQLLHAHVPIDKAGKKGKAKTL